MKPLALAGAILLTASAIAAPKRLTTFDALMTQAKSGHTIAAVFDYAKMTLLVDGKEEKAPAAIGGMTFSNWEFFDIGVVRNKLAYVVSSETQTIAHPRYGHVLNYVRARIYSDNSVEITAQYLKPLTYEIVMDETFKGKISNGKDANGASFFARG
jgi:hypothetical protein